MRHTPVEWEYLPVSRLERLGQHTGFTTNALVKVTPRSASSVWTFGIAQRVSARWSSV